jgi:hypothetical protein
MAVSDLLQFLAVSRGRPLLMIEFARGHRGIRKVLGQLVAGDQGYVNLKRKLARSALKPL